MRTGFAERDHYSKKLLTVLAERSRNNRQFRITAIPPGCDVMLPTLRRSVLEHIAVVIYADTSGAIEAVNSRSRLVVGPNNDVPDLFQPGPNWLGPENRFLNPIPKR